ASDKVLGRMRRQISRRGPGERLDKIRREVPGIHIRTTLMVGFPGEGEKEFDELLDFVKKQRFERMGAFAYCEEEDTFGARNFTDDIPDDVKQQRLDRLMKVQEEISLEIQQQKVGTVVEVVIDSEEDDYYIGRTQWDSPEVDPQVLVEKTDTLIPGKYYNVRITEALPFELVGHIC
ncbi:MAG: 30S ribosomal protein S12 methylthiotransferase RimO, partial [Muribaculaceae bacterium]|nr:30S ribosomal protein S12 methylthiotransferase RimO [Muribaculaceae bacterium]